MHGGAMRDAPAYTQGGVMGFVELNVWLDTVFLALWIFVILFLLFHFALFIKTGTVPQGVHRGALARARVPAPRDAQVAPRLPHGRHHHPRDHRHDDPLPDRQPGHRPATSTTSGWSSSSSRSCGAWLRVLLQDQRRLARVHHRQEGPRDHRRRAEVLRLPQQQQAARRQVQRAAEVLLPAVPRADGRAGDQRPRAADADHPARSTPRRATCSSAGGSARSPAAPTSPAGALARSTTSSTGSSSS